jgi:hypothetical protein
MNPEMTNLYIFYSVMSVAFMAILLATAVIQLRKYREKGLRLHLWAGVAFMLLFAHEIIQGTWIIGTVLYSIEPSTRPWHLSALSILFSLTLLGLSMSGRIRD